VDCNRLGFGFGFHTRETLLQMGVPHILDLIVCSSWQVRSNSRPSVPYKLIQFDDMIFLFGTKIPAFDVRFQVVRPPQATTLSTTQKPCLLGQCTPVPVAMFVNVRNEYLILV
jgi:hypothetical protein